MTPNKSATTFFQKVYLSCSQDRKNGQICTPFALLKDKACIQPHWDFALTSWPGALPADPAGVLNSQTLIIGSPYIMSPTFRRKFMPMVINAPSRVGKLLIFCFWFLILSAIYWAIQTYCNLKSNNLPRSNLTKCVLLYMNLHTHVIDGHC